MNSNANNFLYENTFVNSNQGPFHLISISSFTTSCFIVLSLTGFNIHFRLTSSKNIRVNRNMKDTRQLSTCSCLLFNASGYLLYNRPGRHDSLWSDNMNGLYHFICSCMIIQWKPPVVSIISLSMKWEDVVI